MGPTQQDFHDDQGINLGASGQHEGEIPLFVQLR